MYPNVGYSQTPSSARTCGSLNTEQRGYYMKDENYYVYFQNYVWLLDPLLEII